MWIVIAGNPIDGFNYYGPFKDGETAAEWAQDGAHEWWIVQVEPPKEGP